MKVHFIAVGGTGMGALAVLMAQAGHDVRGSDEGVYPPMSTQLAKAEIEVFEGFSPANLDWSPDCVVVGNVCRKDHIEVVAAQQRGIRLESFPSLLANAILPERRSLVVAGTHGKTTTSSLLTWCLRCAGQDPSWLVGGVPQNLQVGSRLAKGRSIVIEGDEYDTAFFDKGPKFLHYRPERAVLTSVEWDHADIFPSLQAVREAFARFIALIPEEGELVVNRGDAQALALASQAKCRVTTYQVLADHPAGSETSSGDTVGLSYLSSGEDSEGGASLAQADYSCRLLSKSNARRSVFEVFEHGKSLGEFSTSLIGRYNLGNILAAIAVARAEGCEPSALREAIRCFRGVKRRQELVGVAQGVRVVDDFAHHPTAVRLTVDATRRRFPENGLRVCFEPRSASSRRNVFMQEYSSAFRGASEVYIGPAYAGGTIAEEERMDTEALAAAVVETGVSARAFADTESLAATVQQEARAGDTVLVLSSGAFDGLIHRLLDAYGDAVVRGVPEDTEDVNELLGNYELTQISENDDLDSLVIRDEHGLVGCVHLQMNGESAHFFGLAVRRGRRGEGLGWALADRILRRARTLGARLVYLVSADAADFFAGKFGFAVVDEADLGAEISACSSFQDVRDRERSRGAEPVFMVCDLSETPKV